MLSDSITLRDLLKDPIYKQWFLKVPQLPQTMSTPPWKLMILKEGETQWRTKRFETYPEAFNALKKVLPTSHDALINCPGFDWQPPIRLVKVKGKFHEAGKLKGQPVLRALVWKPQLQAEMAVHYWCPYCRRPTKFGYFEAHIAMTRQRMGGNSAVDPTLMRCFICGASERVVNLRHPANHQNWDVNRTKVG